jgi:hypothetical protein
MRVSGALCAVASSAGLVLPGTRPIMIPRLALIAIAVALFAVGMRRRHRERTCRLDPHLAHLGGTSRDIPELNVTLAPAKAPLLVTSCYLPSGAAVAVGHVGKSHLAETGVAPVHLGYDPGVAQLAERPAVHREDAGSNPALGVKDTRRPAARRAFE